MVLSLKIKSISMTNIVAIGGGAGTFNVLY